jgi:hypothetical protein
MRPQVLLSILVPLTFNALPVFAQNIDLAQLIQAVSENASKIHDAQGSYVVEQELTESAETYLQSRPNKQDVMKTWQMLAILPYHRETDFIMSSALNRVTHHNTFVSSIERGERNYESNRLFDGIREYVKYIGTDSVFINTPVSASLRSMDYYSDSVNPLLLGRIFPSDKNVYVNEIENQFPPARYQLSRNCTVDFIRYEGEGNNKVCVIQGTDDFYKQIRVTVKAWLDPSKDYLARKIELWQESKLFAQYETIVWDSINKNGQVIWFVKEGLIKEMPLAINGELIYQKRITLNKININTGIDVTAFVLSKD